MSRQGGAHDGGGNQLHVVPQQREDERNHSQQQPGLGSLGSREYHWQQQQQQQQHYGQQQLDHHHHLRLQHRRQHSAVDAYRVPQYAPLYGSAVDVGTGNTFAHGSSGPSSVRSRRRPSDASTASSSSRVTVQQRQEGQQQQRRDQVCHVSIDSAVADPARDGDTYATSQQPQVPFTIPRITMTAAGEKSYATAGSSSYSAMGAGNFLKGSDGGAGSSAQSMFGLENSDEQGMTGSSSQGGVADATSGDKGKKKANPLIDLIETETAYVNELGKIIKKVAGAWSRSNFPPAELDTMFRNIESIYRINRGFLKSLKEIGPNPSSPRALGDLLMRWIDDLEAPYQRYCDNYFTDFDSWPTIQSNQKLPPLLESVSEIVQPDGTPVVYSDKKRSPGQIWTLDQLFALPQIRLKYYKKLYARLLKSTQEGRSDHKLLVGANEKLDELLQHAKNRISMSVLDEGPVQLDNRQSNESGGNTTANTLESDRPQRESSSTSLSASEQRKGQRASDEQSSIPTNLMPAQREEQQFARTLSVAPLPNPHADTAQSRDGSVTDLETRLDTSQVVDIFTMKPKKCQLRMNPPGIPFNRELRKAADVVIHFTPTSTGQDIVIRRAHLFLLTDLFLICERMTPSERSHTSNSSRADMWLLYPPLAGKHLRVQDEYRQDNAFSITILKKEKLMIQTDSREAKQEWIREIEECQQFGSNMGLKVKTDQSSATLTSNATLPTPAASPVPAISMTPSGSDDPAAVREGDTVRDLTKVLDGSHPFSPPSPSPSRTPSLHRDGSFRSFVGDQKSASSPPPTERPDVGATSPISLAQAVRPQQQRQGSLPPLPLQPGMIMSPPSLRPHVMSPQPISSISPSSSGANFAPSSGFMNPHGAPGAPSHVRDAPPTLPPTRPPQHLVNATKRPTPPHHGYSERPPFLVNGNGRPPHGPSAPQATAMRPPNYGPGLGSFHRPPPRPQMSMGPPPLHREPREPIRRPSEPNLRNGSIAGEEHGRSKDDIAGAARTRSSSSSGPPKLPSDFLRDPRSRPRENYSPPPSPPLAANRGPKSSSVAAQMRCRLYLKQGHQQWKALGNARLKLYHLMPDDIKQLVVENDKKQAPLISSIILADGVERVGKVGVAVELSDNGARTGIVYMLHLRSEDSAVALFGQLLEGSDRKTLAS